MEPWNSARVLNFCLSHARQRIIIRERGTTLKLIGTLATLGDRDACAMDLVEAELDLGVTGLHCALTLHEGTVLLHLTGGCGDSSLFLSRSIPYDDLVLEGGETAQKAPVAEPRSPYELL
jgi:hypothetical protein